MASSVERIEQEIATLDKAVEAIAEEFHRAYSDYLKALGQAVHKQFILANYHVCTQGYPTQFLNLSFGQRQDLQQTLRNLMKQAQLNLSAKLQRPGTVKSSVPDYLFGNESLSDEFAALELSVEPDDDAIQAEREAERSLTPDILAHWQEELEQEIVKELRMASHCANHQLQQAGILPKKLPESLLQTASKSEMSEMAAHSPNLLNVLIEANDGNPLEQDDFEDSKPSVVHIMAIHLRLSEIEFADSTTVAIRNKIRSLSTRLKSLAREYHKKQRERAIAQAQDAWRASWFEE
ncbi:MAG: hypothetical protein HC866_14040 [Leptolyngbyaceae cyanobacterium RU_5_1]|nr:hypothetical protein [Leptolyngbyaceae cyanobacterium RU_5_1]